MNTVMADFPSHEELRDKAWKNYHDLDQRSRGYFRNPMPKVC